MLAVAADGGRRVCQHVSRHRFHRYSAAAFLSSVSDILPPSSLCSTPPATPPGYWDIGSPAVPPAVPRRRDDEHEHDRDVEMNTAGRGQGQPVARELRMDTAASSSSSSSSSLSAMPRPTALPASHAISTPIQSRAAPQQPSPSRSRRRRGREVIEIADDDSQSDRPPRAATPSSSMTSSLSRTPAPAGNRAGAELLARSAVSVPVSAMRSAPAKPRTSVLDWNLGSLMIPAPSSAPPALSAPSSRAPMELDEAPRTPAPSRAAAPRLLAGSRETFHWVPTIRTADRTGRHDAVEAGTEDRETPRNKRVLSQSQFEMD